MDIKSYFRSMGIMRWIDRKLRERRLARMYVIADSNDNSVTMSQELCRHIGIDDLEAAKVYVFRISDTGEYGFCVNPKIDDTAPLADIQYNSKYHCIGFECLVPTVNRIFYDYGMPALARAKLSVEHCTAPGMEYYVIHKPCRT